ACTARSMSSGDPRAMRSKAWPSAGSMTGMVSASDTGRRVLAMKWCAGMACSWKGAGGGCVRSARGSAGLGDVAGDRAAHVGGARRATHVGRAGAFGQHGLDGSQDGIGRVLPDGVVPAEVLQ